MPSVQELVDSKIAGKKVMVFSKSTCPFCTKAKKVFQRYIQENIMEADDYEVLEIESRPDCSDIQDYLAKKTGGRSVILLTPFIRSRF